MTDFMARAKGLVPPPGEGLGWLGSPSPPVLSCPAPGQGTPGLTGVPAACPRELEPRREEVRDKTWISREFPPWPLLGGVAGTGQGPITARPVISRTGMGPGAQAGGKAGNQPSRELCSFFLRAQTAPFRNLAGCKLPSLMSTEGSLALVFPRSSSAPSRDSTGEAAVGTDQAVDEKFYSKETRQPQLCTASTGLQNELLLPQKEVLGLQQVMMALTLCLEATKQNRIILLFMVDMLQLGWSKDIHETRL